VTAQEMEILAGDRREPTKNEIAHYRRADKRKGALKEASDYVFALPTGSLDGAARALAWYVEPPAHKTCCARRTVRRSTSWVPTRCGRPTPVVATVAS